MTYIIYDYELFEIKAETLGEWTHFQLYLWDIIYSGIAVGAEPAAASAPSAGCLSSLSVAVVGLVVATCAAKPELSVADSPVTAGSRRS